MARRRPTCRPRRSEPGGIIDTLAHAWIGLGANLGDARAALRDAWRRLGALPGIATSSISSVYRTAPMESQGPDYLNAVGLVRTSLEPEALLDALQSIEKAHGRERPYRNAPRTLDLDLLLYDDRCIDSARLQVPHPRLHRRAFVLVPLAEVDPQTMIPGRGRVGDLLPTVAAQAIERLGPVCSAGGPGSGPALAGKADCADSKGLT